MYISDYKKTSYNLQLTRFILAVFVIFNHCFPLSTGSMENEWMCVITKGKLSFGGFAVYLFFLCGGFYSARTIITKDDNKYILRRLQRLIPELLIVVISCILLGSLISSLSIVEYYNDIRTWKYLLNSVFILQHELPGVFSNNIYTSTVNGSLWTIPLEFICNVMCYVAFKIHLLDRKYLPITSIFVILGTYLLHLAGQSISLISAIVMPTIMFYIGILYYLFGNRIMQTTFLFICSLILYVICILTGFLNTGTVIFFPYIFFYIWFNIHQINLKISHIGVYSYSIYLWGFPVQQSIVHYCGGMMNPYVNFAISLPIAIVLGIGTNRLISFILSLKT